MGSHADGEVFWGYDLGDMTDDDYEFIGPAWLGDDADEEAEWEEKLAEARGVEPVPFPEHARRDGPPFQRGLDESHPDVIAWKAWRDRLREVARAQPFELATYGYMDGETQWCVRARESVVSATYECKRLDDKIGVSYSQELLRDFMTTLGLPIPDGEPGWFITSSFG